MRGRWNDERHDIANASAGSIPHVWKPFGFFVPRNEKREKRKGDSLKTRRRSPTGPMSRFVRILILILIGSIDVQKVQFPKLVTNKAHLSICSLPKSVCFFSPYICAKYSLWGTLPGYYCAVRVWHCQILIIDSSLFGQSIRCSFFKELTETSGIHTIQTNTNHFHELFTNTAVKNFPLTWGTFTYSFVGELKITTSIFF